MTTDELIAYYVNLLIIQYASLGNARATMTAVIKRLVQDQIVSKVRDGFDVDTAIGAQLDMLGKYRGVSRTLYGIIPGTFWSLVRYGDAAPDSYMGWSEYADADPTWMWMQYQDLNGLPYKLTDSQMRKLIKLKAAIDSSPATIGALDTIFFRFFGYSVTLVDNLDMTMVYQHTAAMDSDADRTYEMAVLAGILPHPAGVFYSFMEV